MAEQEPEVHKLPPVVLRMGDMDRLGLSSFLCMMTMVEMMCSCINSPKAENRRWALKGLRDFGRFIEKNGVHGARGGEMLDILLDSKDVYFVPKEPVNVGCGEPKE